VLATNLRSHLDEAFLRRLDFTVSFPFPDEAARARIWAGTWPPDLPLGPDVDAAVLATRFPLSGGNIRNAALAAAFAAAAEDRPVGMDHVLHAVRREYQKFGKAVDGAGRTG
jgi:ATP-dependent 26S proteasome regulatory subunit